MKIVILFNLILFLFPIRIYAQNLKGVTDFYVNVAIMDSNKVYLIDQIRQQAELRLRYYHLKVIDPIFDGETPELNIKIFLSKMELSKYNFSHDVYFYTIELELNRPAELELSDGLIKHIFVPVWQSYIEIGNDNDNTIDKTIINTVQYFVDQFINAYLKDNN